ncbi:Tetratricopeptide repeat protein [Candidatus Anstonella stagnisolia]|nr:Tetratricopeptide repeat protein [Candidatus Anstonella stagnisolia]
MAKPPSFKPSTQDWELFKQFKPPLAPERISEIQELSSKFLLSSESDFIAEDFHSSLHLLWSLSKTQDAKIPKAQAKKIERLTISAFSSFQKPQIHYSPHSEGDGGGHARKAPFSRMSSAVDSLPAKSTTDRSSIQLETAKYEGCRRIFIELSEELGEDPKKAAGCAARYAALVEDMAGILKEQGINTANGYSLTGQVEFITSIWGIMRSNLALRFGPNKSGFISESLESNVWDCDNSSFLVFDVAKVLGLKLEFAIVPEHVFILTNNYFFETTIGYIGIREELYSHYPVVFKITNNPDELSSISYSSAGIVHLRSGNLNKALLFFDKALELCPSYVDCHIGKLEILLDQLPEEPLERARKLEECSFLIDKLLEEHPNYPRLYFVKGMIAGCSGRFRECFSLIHKGIKLFKEQQQKFKDQHSAFNLLGQKEKAAIFYDKATDPSNTEAAAYLITAQGLHFLGKDKSALKFINKSLELWPDNEDIQRTGKVILESMARSAR